MARKGLPLMMNFTHIFRLFCTMDRWRYPICGCLQLMITPMVSVSSILPLLNDGHHVNWMMIWCKHVLRNLANDLYIQMWVPSRLDWLQLQNPPWSLPWILPVPKPEGEMVSMEPMVSRTIPSTGKRVTIPRLTLGKTKIESDVNPSNNGMGMTGSNW